MSRIYIHYFCACICVLFHLLGKSCEESTAVQGSENRPQSSGDVIMREDAEEMFYNIDLKKYDGMRCPDPVPPENGAIVGEGNQVGSVVYVECRKGCRLEGPAVIACVPVTDGAQWDPLEPTVCIKLEETEHLHKPQPEGELIQPQQGVEPHNEVKQSINSPPSFNPRPQAQRQKHNKGDVIEKEPSEKIKEGANLLSPLCLDIADAGPCRASFKRYYFNKTTMECDTFIYGGCHGNKNNFQTIIDCNVACLGHK